MTPEQFCYWLQGFAELSKDAPPTAEQWKSICDHVATALKVAAQPEKDSKAPVKYNDLQKSYLERMRTQGHPPMLPDQLRVWC